MPEQTRNARPASRDSWLIAVAALVCLTFVAVLLAPHIERAIRGTNDFAPLYSGPHLLASGDLYNQKRLVEVSGRLTGMWSPDQGYIRLPFHAVLLWPLSQLPYRTAYLIWELASLAAVVLFIVLWRLPDARSAMLFCCLSIPVFTALLNGQDTTFLLLWVAAAAVLLDRSRPWAAGLVWSLCALKFHLFLLTPVFIVARKQWRFAGGLAAGGAALAAVSFAAAGWNWPLEYLDAVRNPAFSPALEYTPTLHGVLAFVPGGVFLEVAAGASVLAAVWVVCRRADVRLALAATLAGGLLIGVHAYLPDLSLLLPAGLAVIAQARTRLARWTAFALLSPPVQLTVVQGFPYSAIVVGLVLLLVYAMAAEANAQAGLEHREESALAPQA
jgi:Glycosyltransferase family 87